MKKWKHNILLWLGIVFVIFWIHWIYILVQYKDKIVEDLYELSTHDAVIIFGAHVYEDGSPTPLLKERLEAGKII